ncbi:hypothetical protein Tco_0709896 [Tanacetum coccineum]
MGIMPTKTELALEQTQQGVSNEVLNIKVMLFSIYNDDGNPSSANIKQALRRSDNENKQVTVNLMQSVLEDPILQAGNPVEEVLPN